MKCHICNTNNSLAACKHYELNNSTLLNELKSRLNGIEFIKPIEVDFDKLTFASRNMYFCFENVNYSVGVFSYSSMDDEAGFFRVLTNEDKKLTYSI